ncbi:MAG: 23S rRNA (cytosine(1962)-C(5))-methyltransferase RlmI, partial [Kiritimatiellae bacterium]|nr:23S rRNA (cytosine(1962)-C(5))-methyltransferase RlmI [Kiritimatiellia bacterium]
MSESLPVVRLKPGREKSLLRRHPWVFSGAVADAEGSPAAGAAVEVRSARGDFLARGFWSPDSQIRVRAVVFDETETPDAFWLGGRLAAAWALRALLWNAETRNALRVVHGEGDGLPGLVVDRYADALCVQILSAGFERLRSALAAQLLDLF